MPRPQLISLDVARKTLIPRTRSGKHVSPSTVWRWARKGLEGIDGNRIKLEVTYVGSVPHVTEESVLRFFADITAARHERHRRSDEVNDCSDSELQAAGLT